MKTMNNDVLSGLKTDMQYKGVVVGLRYAREENVVFQLIIQLVENRVYFLNTPWIIPSVNSSRMSGIMGEFKISEIANFEKEILGKACTFKVTSRFKYLSLDFESLKSIDEEVKVIPSKLCGRLQYYKPNYSNELYSRLLLHNLITLGAS